MATNYIQPMRNLNEVLNYLSSRAQDFYEDFVIDETTTDGAMLFIEGKVDAEYGFGKDCGQYLNRTNVHIGEAYLIDEDGEDVVVLDREELESYLSFC